MKKKKILLIEDDKNLLLNVKNFLEEEGFQLKTALDGKNGLDTAKEWKPDLIICDINIPLKDGYQVLTELSKEKPTKTIPFIFLTAKIEKEDLRKGMQLGADDYIFKPFDLDDLLNSIKIRLEKTSFRNNPKDASHKEKPEKETGKNKVYELDDKILISTGSKMQFCSIKDLKFIKTENPYIRLKFCDGKISLIRETLEDWEVKLPAKTFIRIHRAAIINTEFITKIEKLASTCYLIRLKDETEPFVISKRYSSRIRNRFS